MDTEEITAYMEQAAERGIVPGLSATRALLKALGEPQKRLRFVHIAGTNGKGSVLAYVSTVLQAAGYKVGCFYSPALNDPWEKIRVNGRPITEKEVGKGLTILKESGAEGTVFETECALALWYFAKKKCDIAVIECGLGGALDATNVIPAPEVCILTPVSFDHMQFLGNSLKEIASAKAGIIKEGCSVVSAKQKKEAADSIRRAASVAGVPAVRTAESVSGVTYGLEKQSFSCAGYNDLEIRLAGRWQIENAALAVTALLELKKRGFAISETALRKGLAETVWDGRLTVLKKKPLFLMDGAHNEAAAEVLAESLKTCLPDPRLVLILGVLKDKAYDKLLRTLLPMAEHLITLTPPENPRALSGLSLAEAAGEIAEETGADVRITTADSVEEAVEIALLLSDGKRPVLATGSLSWIGRLRGILKKHGRQYGR